MSLAAVKEVYPQTVVTESGPSGRNGDRVYQVAHVVQFGSENERMQLDFYRDRLYGVYFYGFKADELFGKILDEKELEDLSTGSRVTDCEQLFFKTKDFWKKDYLGWNDSRMLREYYKWIDKNT